MKSTFRRDLSCLCRNITQFKFLQHIVLKRRVHQWSNLAREAQILVSFVVRNLQHAFVMWHQALGPCPGNHGSPGWWHWFDSGIRTIGPRKMRHRSRMIVTSIAAPRASTATLGKSQVFPGFSSILQVWVNAHQRISILSEQGK